eukprot:c27702_g1_i2 orf=1696-2772(+)
MQDRRLNFPEDMLSPPHSLIDRRLKSPNEQTLKCPRCDSVNTKFCYYNNYSLTQPRHFCKSCRRYWTKGGALRNVPVGGGCRKNKRVKQRCTEPSGSNHQSESVTVGNLVSQSSSCPQVEYLPVAPSNSMFSSLPSQGDPTDFTSLVRAQHVLRLADQSSIANYRSGNLDVVGSSQFSCLPHSTFTSLSSHLSGLQHIRNGHLALDLTGEVLPEEGNVGIGDLTTIFDIPSQQLAAVSLPPNDSHTFSLAFDTFKGADSDVQWKQPQQKLVLPTEDAYMTDGHGMPFEAHNQQSLESLRHTKLMTELPNLSIKVGGRPNGDWQSGQDNFFDVTTEPNYWNNGAWPDLSGYGPSANPLL